MSCVVCVVCRVVCRVSCDDVTMRRSTYLQDGKHDQAAIQTSVDTAV